MKISFDLDDTIIPGMKVFETEPQSLLHKVFGIEKVRKGTIILFKELKKANHSVGIYTTSYRSKSKINLTFLLYGFSVDFIINQPIHQKEIKTLGVNSTKYPPAFGIDLHVDDSKGLEIEGGKHHFKTKIINEDDTDWVRTIIEEAKILR